MRGFKGLCLFAIFTFLLAGCAGGASNANITIESYDLSEKESARISKTGVDHIEYFHLNGNLKEDDDLQFTVEVYKNGKLEEELLSTSGELNTNFKDDLISFGISNFGDADHDLKILAGIPSGLSTTSYANNMTSSTFGKLVEDKVTLEKNKPVYLAAWSGTTKNGLRSIGGQNGELPEGIDDAEVSILYKVLWTDEEQ
jgi:hypothetical protein